MPIFSWADKLLSSTKRIPRIRSFEVAAQVATEPSAGGENMREQHEMDNREQKTASEPLFLKSLVQPLDDRVEMAKLPKMCKNSFYGN